MFSFLCDLLIYDYIEQTVLVNLNMIKIPYFTFLCFFKTTSFVLIRRLYVSFWFFLLCAGRL